MAKTSQGRKQLVLSLVLTAALTTLWVNFMPAHYDVPIAHIPDADTRAPAKPSSAPSKRKGRAITAKPTGKPFKQLYTPPLPDKLMSGAIQCPSISKEKVGAPRPLPPNPRFLVLADAWERQLGATNALDALAELIHKFNLVLVEPFVHMSSIQGIPGWVQWRSSHALSGFLATEQLLTLSEYYDTDYTRAFVPMISYEEFSRMTQSTATSLIMFDWDNNNCGGLRPEWWPAYGAKLQTTQLLCVKPSTPFEALSADQVNRWFEPEHGEKLPEAEGRPPSNVPAVVFDNWRKHAFQPGAGAPPLWNGHCRFRWNPKWNATAAEFAYSHLPEQYVAIRLRTGLFLDRGSQRDTVLHCFDQIVVAVKYYLGQAGLPLDTPVLLDTDWPEPLPGKGRYQAIAIMTEAFNKFERKLNLVSFTNQSYDSGIRSLRLSVSIPGFTHDFAHDLPMTLPVTLPTHCVLCLG